MTSGICELYFHAKDTVLEKGYSHEIEWQASRRFNEVREEDFLRESAWVILSAGMNEKVIRGKFQEISECFFAWKDASLIANHERECVSTALGVFNHRGKIQAIATIAVLVHQTGFVHMKNQIDMDPLGKLQELPYIGPVTCYHLAKNLGIPVAKPDRHLVRIAAALGYSDVQALCRDVAQLSGDAVPVVDLVLWRFATLEPAYERLLEVTAESDRQSRVE